MSARKVVVAVVIIIVAIGGFVTGLILLQERQELREEAAVPGGQAKVSISPGSGSFELGDTINTSIFFNPAGIPISGVAVRLTYPFSGTTPEVGVESIVVNPTLLSSGDWTCPTQNSTQQGDNVVIDIACANTSATGFTSSTDTLLANVDLVVDRIPETSPVVVRFDPSYSVITRKSDNQDILLIPTSTGSYSIVGSEVTGTPTPTGGQVTTTITPTPSPRATLTGTRTPTPTGLPDAGVSYPTVAGVGVGILIIVGALVLAL